MGIIGRQPVSDASYKICAYDILFRSETAQNLQDSDASISASSLTKIMNDFGLENVLGAHRGYLKVDADFLLNSIVFTIPKERFILMILQPSLMHHGLEERLQRLVKEGYTLGLNDAVITPQHFEQLKPFLPCLSAVKIDALRSDGRFVPEAITALRTMKKTVIASKVETHELFESYISMGADLFQGFYIKRPHILKNSSFSSSQEQIMQVWHLLQQNAEIREIVDALERNHALTLQLMQFINSSFFSFSNEIASVTQIVNLLGRNALANWLLLLMVSTRDKTTPTNHPLLLMVINRTEIMAGLLKLIKPGADRKMQETAYLVGMLSLIHLLFQMEHREFLHKLHVADYVEEAMFEAKGFWGQLLTLTRYIEHADLESIQPFIAKYAIDTDQMNTLITQAMVKVNAFDEMMREMF